VSKFFLKDAAKKIKRKKKKGKRKESKRESWAAVLSGH
jgi:hypothetical protein